MPLNRQQLDDLRKQAEIYQDVNKPVLPDKLKRAVRLLSDKKRSLLNLPYPVYPGDMKVRRPPESDLATNLRKRYEDRGRPFLPWMDKLAAGTDEEEVGRQHSLQNNLLEELLRRQTDFAGRHAPAYGVNPQRMQEELQRLRGLSEDRLRPLAQEGATLSMDRRRALYGLLEGLQEQKTGRRQGRVQELDKLGHLFKYREKKEKEARKQSYEDTARYPWKQAALFEDEIKPYLGVNAQSPPELQEFAGHGVDIAENALNQPYIPYGGKRVAALPPSMGKAQTLAQRMMSPSRIPLKDALGDMMDRERPESFREFLSPSLDRQSGELERQFEDTLRQRKEALNAKYIRLNQYGGTQHQLEQEKAAQDMLKNLAQRQHSLLGEEIQKGQNAFHGEQMRKAQRVALLGESKQQRFGQARDALRSARHRGTRDFLKEQKGLNAAYEDFKRQREAVWPHRRREILLSPQQMPLRERRAR